ncbi:MAG: peroxiredoxin family protein [Rickettsiales bacterium]
MRRFVPLLAAFGVLSFAIAVAVNAAPTKVGDHLPSGFNVLDAQSKPTDYNAIAGDKGAVLLFIRSIDWCPFCQLQVKEWNASREQFEKAGYHVAAISYDKPEITARAREKLSIALPVYADAGSAMIKALGILNTDIPSDSGKLYGIPNPTIYVVNRDGIITHRFAEEGYQKRPLIADVKAALNLQ